MKTLILSLAMVLIAASAVFSQTQSRSSQNSLQFDSSVPEGISTAVKDMSPAPSMQSLQPVLSFDENPYNHNMHITCDGKYYYTINGGSASSGQINKFTLTGILIQTFPIQIDGRGLSYNPWDSLLYASTYPGDIVQITNLSTGSFNMLFPAAMHNSQASFAISWDGTKFYDFYQGTLYIHDMSTGAVVDTITGLSYGPGNYGGEAAVAVDSLHIYTWNSSTKTVYSYDQTGAFIQSMVLDSGDNGHSLAIANNYLFVSKDGNYGIGTWYGYDLSPTTGISEAGNYSQLNVFPNPAKDLVMIKTGNTIVGSKYIITDREGKTVLTGRINNESTAVDIKQLSAGIYFIRVGQSRKQTFTVIKE